jgi:DNA-directed RNA polymerase specialized sigma subunit
VEKFELEEYRALVLEIRQLKGRLVALESSIYSPKGQRYSSTPRASSGNGSTMDDAVSRHVELENFYLQAVAKKEAQQLAIERAIASLSNPKERAIMRARYVEGRPWSWICEKLRAEGYSERTVYRLHGEALLKLREV